MKVFRRIQTCVTIIALWTAMAISNNYEAIGKEVLTSTVLVVLAGMVAVNVLIGRVGGEVKWKGKRISRMEVPSFPLALSIVSFRLMIE